MLLRETLYFTFILPYKAMVRPLLEYANSAWCSALTKKGILKA